MGSCALVAILGHGCFQAAVTRPQTDREVCSYVRSCVLGVCSSSVRVVAMPMSMSVFCKYLVLFAC